MTPTLVLIAVALLLAGAVLLRGRLDGKQRLPGPPSLPLVGTRWLFWTRYRMNKLHEAYEGEITVLVVTRHIVGLGCKLAKYFFTNIKRSIFSHLPTCLRFK